MKACAVVVAVGSFSVAAAGNDPFAASVVSYAAGSNPVPGYTNPLVALGEPTRITSPASFPSFVTPFNAPWTPDEIVSIGEGGSLTIAFDHDITNNSANPFGRDFLIFGNAFYQDVNFPSGVAASLAEGGGIVEVSADLDTWTLIPGAAALSHYPTLSFTDLSDPYFATTGTVPTDFTLPVDPSFNPIGLNFSQIVAGYNGSGGGTGIDIGLAGLSSIQYVRISNPVGSGRVIEIDGISAVAPAPGPVGMLSALGVLATRRRTRR